MSLVSQLQSLLGQDAVLTAEPDVAAYVEDWRGRYRGRAACVVLPSSTAQVSAVMKACHEARVPVVPQGGNTSLCEGAVPRNDAEPAVVVSLARMRRIRTIDEANNSMVVDAGCVLAAIQQAAAERGRLYPVSLGAEGSCQIGGNIATNAGGTGVLRYGNTRDNVLGLEVVLPDGRVWDGLYALRKNNTGLDLKHLFIGSEGTLGVITGATLKLHPLPTAHAVAWIAVASPQAALDVLGLFQQRCGGVLSAYEMINDVQLKIVVDHVPGRRAPLPVSHAWHVLVELADTGGEDVLHEALQQVLEQGSEAGLVHDAVVATSGAQRAAFWEVRHSVSEGNKKAGMGINTDCAVPVSAVPAFIERATQAAHAVVPGAPIIIVAHLGDGNVHFIPQASFEQWRSWPDADAVAHQVKHAVNEVAHSLGGTFSAEHGVGQVLTQEMALFKPAVEIDLMRGIKALLDPQQLLNPGRLLPAASNPPR
ncbi:FAD-binding oxidoreductase [Ramlibacter henchirensis]|uniref:FAD-binding oxidoreductase n=1 Tax=Ramlibacter henchirensis TaxID=204072 RepID=A0A4Z0BMD4_9BURK|nr:FAD-binding oxidoreductase [Ramlibacter henchirensis]TFY99417.1 FAD-binding oxidoreductase [Ramlibacter henchirensis]